MPVTLWRYILREVLRTLLLSGGVLATVIAVGASVRPLTEGSVLSGMQLAKYVSLATVPMLQFAIPFAAGFAATTTLHRLASDNEVLAMSASGMSYRRILAPIAGLGIVLFLVMLLLTQWVIPRFWSLMERTIATDVTRLFEASIDRGVPFEVGNVQIYADRLVVDDDPPGTDAETRLILLRVAAVELDDAGRIVTDITASQAVVDIYRRQDRTVLSIAMKDAVASKARSGELVRTPEFRPTRPIIIPNVLRNSMVAMDRDELLWLRDHPDEAARVIEVRVVLADVVRDLEAWRSMDGILRRDGEVELRDTAASGRVFVVVADRLLEDRFVNPSGERVEVVQYDGDEPVLRLFAREARLARTPGLLGSVAYDLIVRDYEVVVPTANEREEKVFASLSPPDGVSVDLSELPSAELLDRATAIGDEHPAIAEPVRLLLRELEGIQRGIRGHLGERQALAFTAPLLLMLGALMAVFMRHSLPLTIYMWAFLPSILDLMLISGGEHSIRDGKSIGFIVLWSGNILLLLLCTGIYWRLRKH